MPAGDVHVKAHAPAGVSAHAAGKGVGGRGGSPGTHLGKAASRASAAAPVRAGTPQSAHGAHKQQSAAPVAQRGATSSKAVKVSERAAPHKQPLVIPHDYMLSLYWSLSTGDMNSSALHDAGLANTITSFVDKGQATSRVTAAVQSIHVGSYRSAFCSSCEQILVLRSLRLHPPDPNLVQEHQEVSEERGPVIKLSINTTTLFESERQRDYLYTCASGKQQAALLQTKAVEDLLGGFSSKWEVFDVWKVFKGFKTQQNQQNQQNQQLCFELEGLEHRSGRPMDLRTLGLARPGRTNKEKAFFLAFGKSKKRDLFYNEIKARSGHDNKTVYEYLFTQRRMRRAPAARAAKNLCSSSSRRRRPPQFPPSTSSGEDAG
ncbi:Growth/differentiation factor 5 [Nibea albiflora]|uniref:Growth/differentiation factor 5 n=1 Tax=Nibea albiflora TaxID=240163 RepID=A0ACB7EYU7_NIBAL|nr:Growth/differentiation factor 5 [Nibea albiflora]